MDGDPKASGEARAAGSEPGLIRIARDILLDPTAVGESVARKPGGVRALGAFLVLLVLVTGGSLATLRQQKAMALEVARAKLAEARVPAEQRARMEELYAGPAMSLVLVAVAAGAVVVGVPLLAFLLYLGQLVMGGRASYEMTLSIALYASLVSLGLGSLVRNALALVEDSMAEVSTGLGMLVADRPITDPLRSLLDLADPFVIAAYVAAGVALAPPAQLPRGYTLGVALAVWVVLMGGATALRMVQ